VLLSETFGLRCSARSAISFQRWAICERQWPDQAVRPKNETGRAGRARSRRHTAGEACQNSAHLHRRPIYSTTWRAYKTPGACNAVVAVCRRSNDKWSLGNWKNVSNTRVFLELGPRRWWDNLENSLWESMGQVQRVGHDKLLIEVAFCASLLGTTTSLGAAIAIVLHN